MVGVCAGMCPCVCVGVCAIVHVYMRYTGVWVVYACVHVYMRACGTVYGCD